MTLANIVTIKTTKAIMIIAKAIMIILANDKEKKIDINISQTFQK